MLPPPPPGPSPAGMPPPPGLPPLGAPPVTDPPTTQWSTNQWSTNQYSAPAPVTSPKLKPSKSGIWLGVLLMAAGIIAGIAIVVVSLMRVSDRVDKFPRVSVGSSYEMSFSESGDYVVYLEYTGDKEPPLPAGLYVCVVKPGSDLACKDNPDKLTVRSYTNDLSFSFNGTQGKAAFKFNIPEPGKYVFDSEATAASSPRLMVGPSVLNALVGPILLAAAIGGVLFLVGLVLFIVTIVRRKRARRAFGSMPPSSTWSPGAPPMPMGTPAPPSSGGGWTPPSDPNLR